jgi:Fe-S cluster assembly protein SufD
MKLLSMQARGIPKKEAKALLMYAFSNVVIDNIKIPELKQRITKIIANKLGVKWVLICKI